MFKDAKVSLGSILGLLILACGGGGGPNGPDEPSVPRLTVRTGPNTPPRFIPAGANLPAGGIVTWVNASPTGIQHNVVSKTGAWTASPNLNPGESFSVPFPQSGRFEYSCNIHAGMSGVIVVQ